MDVVTLKITLDNTKPPVWRRLEVPAHYHLGELHPVLNAAMGWLDYHLHEFRIASRTYGVPDTDFFPEMDNTLPEELIVIGNLPRIGIKRFHYAYDFGDGWQHTVVIEKTAPAEAGVFYPRCTSGRREAAPEDCGGHWGLAEFLEAMADPEHERHDELKVWYGGDYDPTHFNAVEISELLRTVTTGELPPKWRR